MEQEDALALLPKNGEIISPDVATRAERVRTLLATITQRSQRNLRDAISIGEELQQAKETLAHGQFGAWLQEEFSMSRTSATRYMQLARVFADKLSTVDNLPSLSVAFLLAQVSTPESVRLAVLSSEMPDDPGTIRRAIAAAPGSLENDLLREVEELIAALTVRLEDIHPTQLQAYQATLQQTPHMPEFHEQTNIIPAMQVDEYASLVASLTRLGLINPIITFHGKIIDGRMRYLACRDAGILPQFREWDGDDAGILSYILSRNVYRSHCTLDQRVMTTLDLETFEQKEQHAGTEEI